MLRDVSSFLREYLYVKAFFWLRLPWRRNRGFWSPFYKVKLPLKIRNIKLAKISCDLLHACMNTETNASLCPHNVNTIVTTSISEFTSSFIWIFRQSSAKREVGMHNNNNNYSHWKMLTWEREAGKEASFTNNCTSVKIWW